MIKNTENPHIRTLEGDFNTYILSKFKEHINLIGKEKIDVLDIGGGKGWGKILYTKKWISYNCLDLNESKRDGNINYIKGDITDKNLKLNKKFDIIFTKDTFEHILNPWDATQNIIDSLNEGGLFIFIAPFSWRYHPSPYDTYRYTHIGAQYLFERLGSMKKVESVYAKFFTTLTSGNWLNKKDKTIDSQVFPKPIETIYIGKKDSTYLFSKENLDSDFSWSHKL